MGAWTGREVGPRSSVPDGRRGDLRHTRYLVRQKSMHTDKKMNYSYRTLSRVFAPVLIALPCLVFVVPFGCWSISDVVAARFDACIVGIGSK